MRRLFLFIICASLFLMMGIVSACGGFFCTTVPIDQSAERIIFTINGDDTISAIVGINFVGSAEEFSWVVPVPSPPELDVAPTSALNVLQNATNPRIVPPPNHCKGVIWNDGGLGGGSGFLEQGNVGPYDYAIIASDNPSELIEWLRDNDYQVTEDMQPIIAEYVFEGMYFVAMKLSNDAEVGDIQPVKMTYKSDKPVIPLRLTAVAALDDMPVLVWIFADTPYSPENYVHAEVDFASFRTRSQLIDPWGSSTAMRDYFTDRNRIQQEFDGRAFITEYAMPSINLIELSEAVVEETYLTDLINAYPFVTRLRAQLSPDQMTLDPKFIPDPSQDHVPQAIALSEYVDALQYWGCSNRQFDFATAEELLPKMALLSGNVILRHPESWIKSSLTFNDVPMEAYAPQMVTAEHLDAYFAGKSEFPILVELIDYVYLRGRVYKQTLNLGEDYTTLPEHLKIRLFDFNDLNSNADEPEKAFMLLTTNDDWAENSTLYRTMGSYLNKYAYYAHSKLKYTLAIADSVGADFREGIFPHLLMGFPEGWTESLQEDNTIVIVPDDGRSPRVEIRRSDVYWSLLESEGNERVDQFADDFGLSDDMLASMRAKLNENCVYPVQKYERDGRVGFLTIIPGWLATVSSVPEEFEANQETMRWIAESVKTTYAECG